MHYPKKEKSVTPYLVDMKKGESMDQSIINWVFGAFNALMMFLLNLKWNAIKELQNDDKALHQKIAEVEVLVAGMYVKKSEFDASVTALFKKLDRIEDKIDKKADK